MLSLLAETVVDVQVYIHFVMDSFELLMLVQLKGWLRRTEEWQWNSPGCSKYASHVN